MEVTLSDPNILEYSVYKAGRQGAYRDKTGQTENPECSESPSLRTPREGGGNRTLAGPGSHKAEFQKLFTVEKECARHTLGLTGHLCL